MKWIKENTGNQVLLIKSSSVKHTSKAFGKFLWFVSKSENEWGYMYKAARCLSVTIFNSDLYLTLIYLLVFLHSEKNTL